MTLRHSLSILLAIALQGCSEPLPKAPDLSETLEAYQEGPTAELSVQEVVDLVPKSLDEAKLADELRKLNIIIETISKGLGLPERTPPTMDSSEDVRQGFRVLDGRFFVDLYAELTHVCEGHDPEATVADPETNGTLDIGLILTESYFDGVFWGEFEHCRLRSDEVDPGLGFNKLTFDGPTALELLNPLGFAVERDYLFVFDGTITLNGLLELDGQLDFLVQQGIGTEVRIRNADRAGGQVFLFQPMDNSNALELRTFSEAWQCDIEQQRCLSNTGTQVSW